MKITYTGVMADLLPRERTKLEAKLVKLSKVIERKGEKEAHIIVSKVRHLHKAEITMSAFDHSMAGAGTDADLAVALSAAIEKLEKQVLKLRTKWRDTHRTPASKEAALKVLPAAQPSAKPAVKRAAKAAPILAPEKAKVFRVNHQDGRKPMTLDEAKLELTGQDYVVYRDAVTDRICTLLRRPDGHLDLIES